MAKSKEEIKDLMGSTGMVPVFYHANFEVCKNIIEACFSGGVRVFEYTNRGPEALAVFKNLVEFVDENLPKLEFGIGSIVDAKSAEEFILAGAKFIVSPILNPEVAEVCAKHNIPWSPGCGTVTEIYNAQQLGADVVKVFPASQVGGPGFIKAVKGPMPWSTLMPTGGVKPERENIESWFKAGAFCVGIGSALFIKNADGAFDYEKIEMLTSETIQTIKTIKSA